MHLRRWLSVLVTAAASLVAVAPAAAGAAPVPAGDLWAEQLRLNAAADRIVAAAGGRGSGGYGNIVVAPERRSLEVYWQGKVPAAVQREIDATAKTADVRVLPARHSHAELQATMDRLVAATDSKPTTMTEVELNRDASGVTVSAVGGVLDPSAAAAVQQTRTLSSAVPVTVRAVSGRPGGSGRQNDSSPYYGGARWGDCSTAFAVRKSGFQAMLTAGHCAPAGTGTALDGGGDYMGSIRDLWPRIDSVLIQTLSAPRMFDGPYDSNWTKAVVGSLTVYDGNWLCSSGSFSGVLCSMTVANANTAYTMDSSGRYIQPAFRVQKVGSGPVWGQGDSGGPVFALASGANQVLAVGIISGHPYGTDVPCVGIVNRACHSAGFGVQYNEIAWRMGLTLA